MTGTLSIIATPIGNLEDISERALRTLREVDVLYCEDTRVTGKLLARYETKVPMKSYREHNHEAAVREIISALEEGKHVGYVSDAGTPGISDPGTRLVRDVVAALPEAAVTPIPGPSAVVAAMSIAGIAGTAFTFLGFPPHKKGRTAFFKGALGYDHPVILYESPHRIEKTLDAIEEISPESHLILCRELTKLHETIYRGTAAEVRAKLSETSSKGEFVIVIS